jgi:hypothetical protein
MKIKLVLALLINVVCVVTMYSQVTWFPHGAKWHYDFGSMLGSGLTTLEVLEEDTSTHYKRILSTTVSGYSGHLDTFYETLYVREQNQVVYGYGGWGWGGTLYDFTANVGDTLDMYIGGISPYPFVVDSIGEENINGHQLKFQIIRFPSGFKQGEFYTMKVMEGIGSVYSHLFHDHIVFQPTDAPTYNFRCYEDENIGLVNLTFNQIECDYIEGITSISPVTENSVSVLPNPADDFLIVNGNSRAFEHLLIVDQLGKVRINEKITSPDNKQLDIHELENGIYFVIGEDRKGQILFREKFCKFSD